ncbi:MAG: DUF4375 domain-containing protein [Gemmataceae bacterium]|nr:DUF4375 domain-containing protein [Gemmataceae bacterium]
MNFRDFMTSTTQKLRSLLKSAERPLDVQIPRNPTPTDIERLVAELLDDDKCERAEAILDGIGTKASTALEKAALDPAFHLPCYDRRGPSPLQQIMYLLEKHAPSARFETAVKLIESAEDNARKIAASIIGESGRLDAIPLIERLLNDPDGFVRSSVWFGVREVIDKRPDFRAALYPLYLGQCRQEWTGTLNDAPSNLLNLDEARALADLAGESYLSPDNPVLNRVLEALAVCKAPVPETRIRQLLSWSKPHLNGENPYPHHYIVASCLVLLAKMAGKKAEPEIREWVDCRYEEIQTAVGDALCFLAGLTDPLDFLWRRVEAVGVEELTPSQGVVYFAEVFQAEVCDGGLSQFFGNSSGRYVSETLEALRTLGHPEALAALETAVAEIGPTATRRDRDTRLAPFADRYEELQEKFEAVESKFYKSKGHYELRLRLYMIDHATDFGSN